MVDLWFTYGNYILGHIVLESLVSLFMAAFYLLSLFTSVDSDSLVRLKEEQVQQT
jgi:hypothetical protein